MKLPEAFTNDSDLGMCYEKKVILNPDIFYQGNIPDQIHLIHMLLQRMKESNEINKHDFPFYQLRVRPARWEEDYGHGCICFELRWGSREMLNAITNSPLTDLTSNGDTGH